MIGDFGLTDTLGEDGTVKLVRRQRDIARRHSEHEAVERLTAWLVSRGYEKESE